MADSKLQQTDTNRDKVMQRLRDEHAYIGTLRKAMAAEADKLKGRQQPDLVILRDMMRYLMEYPDLHHHPLEDQIFGKLMAHRNGIRSEAIELLSEHKDLAKESQYLYHKLDALVQGDEKLQKHLLRSNLSDFLEQYGEHVREEETVAFPAAEAVLSKQEWREIAQTMPSIDDPVFGMGNSEKFARLRHRVAETVDTTAAVVTMSELLGLYTVISAMGAASEGAEELMELNRQQLHEFKTTNIAAVKESDSVAQALRKLSRENRRLIKSAVAERIDLWRATRRAVWLPFSESFGLIAGFARGQRTQR